MFFGPKVDLSPSDFREALQSNGGRVIDCRTASECLSGMYPGAENVDWMAGRMNAECQNWDRDEPIYCYCRSGARSGAAVQFLRNQGFKKVFNVGGYGSLR